jgi:hypothetical protein
MAVGMVVLSSRIDLARYGAIAVPERSHARWTQACIDNPGLTVWIGDGIGMLPARLKSRSGAVGDVGGGRPKRMPKNSAVAKFSSKPSLLNLADESLPLTA